MLFLIAVLSIGGPSMAVASETRSMKLALGRSEYSEFFDFLYSYAASNRLNVQWLGWYKVPDATRWFERSDRDSDFKVNIHLLQKKTVICISPAASMKKASTS